MIFFYNSLCIFMDLLVDIIVRIIFGIGTVLSIIFCIDFLIASRKYAGEKNDHFDGKHFMNFWWTKKQTLQLEQEDRRTGYIYGFLRFILERKREKWKKRSIDMAKVVSRNNDDDFRITLIGHATVLIQIAGINIITDPVYAYRASPFPPFGPRRFTPPGIAFDDLPTIDIVLLSHNHYDHMDIVTLRNLSKRDNPKIYTGLWNTAYIQSRGVPNSTDMDWWDSLQYNKNDTVVDITYLPAQHFSARGITDRNRALWWWFALKIKEKTLYFAWDTGYGSFLETIKSRFPHGFDVGLLPIGAYKPKWFIAKIHTWPKEALQIQKDLAIKTWLAIHWGVFALADDGQDDPINDLRRYQKQDGFRDLDFRAWPSGTVWELP